jgi:hypothetical protein
MSSIAFPNYGGIKHLWNVGLLLQDSMAQYIRRLSSSKIEIFVGCTILHKNILNCDSQGLWWWAGGPDLCLGNVVAVETRIFQFLKAFALPFIAIGTITVVPPDPGSFLQNGYWGHNKDVSTRLGAARLADRSSLALQSVTILVFIITFDLYSLFIDQHSVAIN